MGTGPTVWVQMTRSDWAFVAGFWQGEGTIYSYKRKEGRVLRVNIIQTDPSSIKWLRRKLKIGWLGSFVNRSHLGKKRVYEWRLSGLNALKFIQKILPYITSTYRRKQIGKHIALDKKYVNHEYRNHNSKIKWPWR